MTRRLLFILGMLAGVLLINGCAKDVDAPTRDGIGGEIADPETGVVIRTHIDQNQIATSDRLWVSVTLGWTPPVMAMLVEPDWAETGWTLIDSHIEPAIELGSGFEQTSSYLIEPFLPGAYEIGPFIAKITASLDARAYTMSSQAIAVDVRSVLDAQDTGELGGPDGFVDPRAMRQAKTEPSNLLPMLGGAGLLISIIVLWRLTRRPVQTKVNRSIYAQLKEVADGRCESESAALSSLQSAFNRLDLRLQRTSEIRLLIDQCERARFSPANASGLEPKDMAQHTLDLLGVSESGQA